MSTRISRDDEGLLVAEAAALRADCTRRQVGAAIMAPDGSFVALGRNGLAAGRPGCLTEGACPRGQLTYDEQPADVAYELTGCRAIHAEANAIIRAGRDRTVGATIYVTQEPCFGCSVLIEGAGIVRVVTPDTEYDVRTRPEPETVEVLTADRTEPIVITITGTTEPDPLAVHLAAADRRAELALDHPGWRP